MTTMEDAQKEIAKKQAAAGKLKDMISGLDPLATASCDVNSLVRIGQGLDVFGMVLTGIDIVSTVKDALDVARMIHLLHDSELGAMTLKESGNVARLASSGSTSVAAASRFLFAANVLGVLATYVGVWISLGAGYAQAKVDILTDQAMSGASRGVILGANYALAPYVTQNFELTVKPSYPMYREVESAAMNMYNIALLAGYAHGAALSQNQKVNLGRFLFGRMTPGQRSYFSGGWSSFGARRKIDYYIETAAVFRGQLLQ
jgi:hypothetical protein